MRTSATRGNWQRAIRATIITLLLSLMSVPLLAQVEARVSGYTKDEQGNPIVGATVVLSSKETGRKYQMKTGKDGKFLNIGVYPGTYDVALIKDGKTLDTATNFPVNTTNETNELDFDLQAEHKQQGSAAPTTGNPAQPAAAPKMTEEQRKQYEEAEKKREEATKYNAKVGNLNNLLKQATAAIQAKDYAQADQLMQQGVQIDANQPLIWGRLGDAQNGEKKYKECTESYTKAIDLETKAPKSNPQITAGWYNNLGSCQAKAGDVQTAMQSFDKSAQLDPTMAGQAYFNEGAVLTNLGKPDEANTAFDKAIAADPTKPEPYYQKGINLMQKATTDKSGKIVPAPGTAEALQKYLELAPNGPNADSAKQLLASLGESVNMSFGKGKTKKK